MKYKIYKNINKLNSERVDHTEFKIREIVKNLAFQNIEHKSK